MVITENIKHISFYIKRQTQTAVHLHQTNSELRKSAMKKVVNLPILKVCRVQVLR